MVLPNKASRALSGLLLAPKKRIAACLAVLLVGVFTYIVISSASSRLEREERIEQLLGSMRDHLDYLDSQYRGKQEAVLALQAKMFSGRGNSSQNAHEFSLASLSPSVQILLKNMTGSKAAGGVYTKHISQLRIPFVYQLLPHLMDDPQSLRPAYHMSGGRSFCEIVVGVPTVKRDKESYLMVTLTHLVTELTPADVNNTLIVVMVGETELDYVLQIARQIETMFPTQVGNGLIEVISPRDSYYPDFDKLPDTLGDSHKRVKWRSKQNLDTIFLMAYAQSKGTFYLMVEDDIIAKKNYIQIIKKFIATTTVSNPNWIFIEFCHIGNIGKLFRSAELMKFINYAQIFYNNLPIDWLLESYLADRVCNLEKTAKKCAAAKDKIRPKFKPSLFQHIGIYSSLKGKIHKSGNVKSGVAPKFFPHTDNPPLRTIKTDITEHSAHSLQKAYAGQTFFWGQRPKKGNFVEFWFERPIVMTHYVFRSGNPDHVQDLFYNTTLEVLAARNRSNFTVIGTFDEFGLAEDDLSMGPITAIRLRVHRNSSFWVILSEIQIKVGPAPEAR
ncbi:unnamed protein product [Spodoptera littoralis]|uniref:Alpha-1,3-mannosyl-glycoprotein 4-beta-N-acetylglucosaminyltransferase A n=1 Tax=Spodoptera littoralis TaxID=7109 RepID=A0A9P0N9J1_SPOLI|nr:unnamed protein product [Spodoptera littoralis]CAH1647351.1 unnamed protein product [Spodoptera littoralis]